MERSIRIGKDFNVRWSIHRVEDGERRPYVLAGKEMVLQYRTPYGLKEATEWKVVGNTIVWTFRGKEQKALGSYELILTENGGKDGMVTVDTCRAFKLVAHSCEETEGSGSDIVTDAAMLESEVAFAPIVSPSGESYDDTAIWEALASLEQLIEDLQNMKIDRENDDYYPKMAVGLADNLAGVDVVDSEINFRRSGGGAITDGMARIESIKGNSVVWNQQNNPYLTEYVKTLLALNGNSYSVTNELSKTEWVTISKPIEWREGHFYIVIMTTKGSPTSGFYINANTTVYPNTPKIFQSSEAGSAAPALRLEAGNVGVTFSLQAIDLTQMFGSGNEPTTIEEFYQRIPMGVDLNAYNEGEVIHMDVQSIESVGVNQWDEEWELGRINPDTGTLIASQKDIRSKNFISVIPGKDYYFIGNSQYYVVYYDKDYQHVDWWNIGSYRVLTIPNNVHYVKLSRLDIATYAHDICVNLNDTAVNGKYYPYIKRVEDLAVIRKYFPDGMKSAGSAHDEIRRNKASGKREYSKGRMKAVDLGTLSYTIGGSGDTQFFYTEVIGKRTNPMNGESSKLLCGVYTTGMVAYYSQEKADMTIYESYSSGQGSVVYIKNSAYTDAASFKAAMQGVILYYEAAEWEWVELDEADQFKDLDYQVWNDGTEKANAEGKSAPLAADITYGFNSIGKIKELESLVAALRSKVGI